MEEKQKTTSKQLPAYEQLSAELKKHRAYAAVGKAIIYTGAAVTLICFFVGNFWLILCGIVIAAIGAYMEGKHRSVIKKKLSEEVVTNTLKEVFDNVEYKPFSFIPSSAIQDAGMTFPFFYDTVKGSDYVKADYKGLPIELSDIELYRVEEYEEENGTRTERRETVFQGQWLICDFGKELSGEVHLSARSKKLFKNSKQNGIRMDNEAFNERFLVLAKEEQEAFYILTPHMMDYILTMADKSGEAVYMSFLRGGKLHIAVYSGRDFFELGKGNVDITALHNKFLSEIRWFTDIIDELQLVDTFYRKEPSV